MPAGYQDLFLNQAETFTTSLTLNDANGTPYNLTDFTVKSYAKKSYYTNNTTIVFDALVEDANNGIIQLAANSAITANVAAGKLVYDVFITQTSTGASTKVLEGQIFVSPAVTI
jgi:hypothetical protein